MKMKKRSTKTPCLGSKFIYRGFECSIEIKPDANVIIRLSNPLYSLSDLRDLADMLPTKTTTSFKNHESPMEALIVDVKKIIDCIEEIIKARYN